VHTVAASNREELIGLGFRPGLITAIPNGVDTVRFAPGDRAAARLRWGIPADAQVAGIVGRFGPFKGHALLFEAFETIAARLPRLHLLVAGSGGPLEQEIARRAGASAFKERIHLTGFLAEPREAFHCMDVLAIPSTNEGMSNVALEAMACGVPVLANDRCGHEQMVSRAEGILRDLRSAPALATALVETFANPARLVDFGANARSRIAADFSLTRMLDHYDQLYRAIALRR
jgi:glycosyltransferase involved in cell wall biosynthesis